MMIGIVDLAATSRARAAQQAPSAPPAYRAPMRSGSTRRAWIGPVLIAIRATCGILGHATDARAQAAPTCATVVAEIDALNARLVSRSTAMSEAVQTMMAAQAAQRTAMEAQQRQGRAAGIAGSLLGSILPGGDLVGSVFAQAAAKRPAMVPVAPGADVVHALEASAAQAEDATRAGALMAQHERLGC